MLTSCRVSDTRHVNADRLKRNQRDNIVLRSRRIQSISLTRRRTLPAIVLRTCQTYGLLYNAGDRASYGRDPLNMPPGRAILYKYFITHL